MVDVLENINKKRLLKELNLIGTVYQQSELGEKISEIAFKLGNIWKINN